MTEKIVVLSTCGSEDEAARIAKHLVEARLAACVNVMPRIRSFYRWQGKIEEAEEWLLVVKTSRDRFDSLRAALEAAHSYELPEVLAIPVVDGSPNYLAWLDAELAPEQDAGSDMPEIRAFLFDMDGVIVDSNPLHRDTWAEYTRLHGGEPTEAMLQGMYGKRNDMIVRNFLGDHLTDAEVFAHGAAKEALYRQHLGPVIQQTLVPGLIPFLERHAGIPKAVASNAEPANIEFVLRAAGIARFFRVTVDGQQVANPKPHPDVFLRAADLLNIPPANCVVFEDSLGGVQAGVAAGMRVVGITTTHADLPGASFLARDFNDPSLDCWLASQLPVKP